MTITLYNYGQTGELNELHAVKSVYREELHGEKFIACEYDDELRLFPASQWEIYAVEQ